MKVNLIPVLKVIVLRTLTLLVMVGATFIFCPKYLKSATLKNSSTYGIRKYTYLGQYISTQRHNNITTYYITAKKCHDMQDKKAT